MIIAAIVLLAVALALVAAELFVPTHGLLAVVAIIVAIGGIILGYQASPLLGLGLGLLTLIGAPVVFIYAVRIYPHTPLGKRVLLNRPSAAGGFNDESTRLASLVGLHGTALTLLRPTGSIEINGEQIDAVSESDMIEAGARVEVLRVTGLKVIVKALA